ncbi:hypothetical protein C8R43DRAFT_876050, partial [Mycena crocata]
VLVRNGCFPSAPIHPRYAIPIMELQFWRRFAQEDAPSNQSIANSYQLHYKDMGFGSESPNANLSRQMLGNVIYWHDNLRILLQRELETITSNFVSTRTDCASVAGDDLQRLPTNALSVGLADHELGNRCPACFSMTTWGRSFNEGGDVHCEVDATFSLRHNKDAGTGHSFSEPLIFISKSEVDAVGRRIDKARQKPRAAGQMPPHGDPDMCAQSHNAAKESGWKTSSGKFDETGVMVCCCRHGIPLLAARIDTPGEQQKYVVALFEHLMRLLPPSATLVLLYDIGCVLDRSLNLYEITPKEFRERLLLCTSVMHSYGHQWRCQIIYNPRLRPGIGLTDGEGVERIWSRLRFLISTTRSQSASRRIWALERQLFAIAETQCENLGSWIQKRNVNLQKEFFQSWKVVEECNISIDELRHEWQKQVRSHTSQEYEERMDKIIDKYIKLAEVEQDSRNSWQSFLNPEATESSSCVRQALIDLEVQHGEIKAGIETEISLLGLNKDFMTRFSGVDVAFVRKLLTARILKRKVRTKVIGNFFEYDRLAQSKSGKHAALGNQVYVQTTRAIAKRRPGLLVALNVFNKCCEELKQLYKPSYRIPIPSPLTSNLDTLKNDAGLLDDVWIGHSEPRWLEEECRVGIQALLKADRCVEEYHRVCREAENIAGWVSNRLSSTQHALRSELCGMVYRRLPCLLLNDSFQNKGIFAISSSAKKNICAICVSNGRTCCIQLHRNLVGTSLSSREKTLGGAIFTPL